MNILSIFPLNLLYFGKFIYFKEPQLIKISLKFALEKLKLDISRDIKEYESENILIIFSTLSVLKKDKFKEVNL